MSTRPYGFRSQQGVALIEVLVAFLILSIGLIGFSALQTRTLKTTQSALQRTKAVMLANAILESARANKAAALNITLSQTCSTPGAGSTLAGHDINNWFTALKVALGNTSSTCASLVCGTASCTVNIQWNDSRVAGGSSKQTLSMVGRL